MAKRNIRALYPSCKPVVIYGLVDPRDGSLKYIGKTETPDLRRKHHIWESSKRDDPKGRWIKSLLVSGYSPELVIIETVEPGGDWAQAEKRHIAARREDLLNQSSGGQGVPSDGRGEKWRKALAASHVDNPNRQRGSKAAAEKNRGRKHTEEHRAKIGAANKGRKLTPEHIAKVVAFHKGRKRSPEIAKKCGLHRIGKKNTPESNEKRRQSLLADRDARSERQRNNWANPDYRSRVLSKMVGRPITESVKEKLAKTSTESWENPDHRLRRTNALRIVTSTPEWSESRRQIAKRLWSDPEFRSRMKEARRKK